jgi:hypothetical protein
MVYNSISRFADELYVRYSIWCLFPPENRKTFFLTLNISKTMKPILKTVIWLTVFGIAMGFLETAVVVYIRELYYPTGFKFPVVSIRDVIIITELGRELATIIMILAIGYIAGKNFAQRFVFFLYVFAIWDIFYYVFLKVLLDWPATIFDWDVLFLIPVPWVGPVLAPCIISLVMIAYTGMVVRLSIKDIKVVFRKVDWLLMIAASVILITSFTEQYFRLVTLSGVVTDAVNMMEKIRDYIPKSFNWYLFFVGIAVLVADIVMIFRRVKER